MYCKDLNVTWYGVLLSFLSPYIVLDILAQLVMTWMLLWISLGWTMGGVSTHPVHDRKQLALLLSVSAFEVQFRGMNRTLLLRENTCKG